MQQQEAQMQHARASAMQRQDRGKGGRRPGGWQLGLGVRPPPSPYMHGGPGPHTESILVGPWAGRPQLPFPSLTH